MPETTLTYIDIDFVANYNAANSTNWVSGGDVVWIPSTSRYWLSLQSLDASNSVACPYTFAIIDPSTRVVVGFADGGASDYGVRTYCYGLGSDAVFSKEDGFGAYYYRKYLTDGTLSVDPSPISTTTDGDHSLFPSDCDDVLFSWAYHTSESFTQNKVWRWDVSTMTPDTVVLENYYDPPTPSIFNAYRPGQAIVYGNSGKLYVIATNPNGDSVNSQLWEIDPADNSATNVATYTGTMLRIHLHRAANDSILVFDDLVSPAGAPAYSWIDLSDFSIGTAFAPGAWFTDLQILRCDDGHDLIEIIVWDGDGVGHFATVDPDDDFSTEPTYYSIDDSPYGDGFDIYTRATAAGYPNQVWANHYHYDYDTDVEYYYTRIWPGSVASRRWVNVNINMRRR